MMKILLTNSLSLRQGAFVFVLGLVLILIKSCVPPEYGKETFEGVALDFKDPQVQAIYNLQEKQGADSLLLFFRHENPTYRYAAILAYASLKDKKGLDSLSRLLKDEFVEVRTAAAYAMGQLGETRAEDMLLAAFESQDTVGKYASFNAAIMEAVGKCGTTKRLKDLCTISTFKKSDSVLLSGQVYGIYRYGMRDSFTYESIKKMLSFVTEVDYPHHVRMVAAQYLSRLKAKMDSTITNPIGQIALAERNPDIRMALAKTLGKAYNPAFVLPTIETLWRQETDYRVKVNILNAMGDFDYKLIRTYVLAALKDKNPHVANTAAQFLLKHGSPIDIVAYKQAMTDSDLDLSTRQLMMGTTLKWTRLYPRQRDSVNLSLQNAYKSATNPYEKARLLRGLAEYGWNYPLLRDEAMSTANPAIVRTAATEALASINASPDFFRIFKGYSTVVKRELKNILFRLVYTADAGVAAVAAESIRDPAALLNIKLMKDSVSNLYRTMQSLKLPQELETYESIRQTINYIEDTSAVAKRKSTNQRVVDWGIITSLSDQATATIKTSKGDIKLKLLVRNAPISVANFVSLARTGFFNNKIFHRVVPNFVIQTGCPRGDGYGSLDYTISSELTPMHYDTEGYVGMASAGNHTECSQWFITHSPTIHLDPNYTIFAKVIEGMDVVHKMTVGDTVESVSIN